MNGVTWHTRQRVWTGPDGEERKRWEYRLELPTVGGARQRVTRGGFRTEKAMKTALQKELEARQGGTFAEPSRQSFADYLNERWLPWTRERVKRPVRETTHDLYCRMARLHVLPALGGKALQDIAPLDVEALYMALAKPSADGKRKALSAGSLHNVASVVHGSLEQARRWELIGRNPAAGLSPERPQADHEPAHWTAEQAAAFLDHIDATMTAERTITGTRKRRKRGAPGEYVEYAYTRTVAADPMQRALWYVFVVTAERRGEVCGLRWSDLDEDTGLLEVKVSRVQVGGKTITSDPKTKRGRRLLQLDPDTLAVLAEWRRVQRRERLRYGAAWEDTEGHIFTHSTLFTRPVRHGVPVAPRWVSAALHKATEGSGLPPLHVHGLRHTWGTAAHEAGEPLRAISEYMGHAETSITDRLYVHTVRRVQDQTALRVAGLIAGKRKAASGA